MRHGPCALPAVWAARSRDTPRFTSSVGPMEWPTDKLDEFILGRMGQERVLHSHLRFFEVFPPPAFLGAGLVAGLPPGLFPPPAEPPPGGSRLK